MTVYRGSGTRRFASSDTLTDNVIPGFRVLVRERLLGVTAPLDGILSRPLRHGRRHGDLRFAGPAYRGHPTVPRCLGRWMLAQEAERRRDLSGFSYRSSSPPVSEFLTVYDAVLFDLLA